MEEIGVQLYVCVKVLAKAVRDAFTPRLTAIGVFLPLMPSGVEHKPLSELFGDADWVFLPLMPSGVEHSNMASDTARSNQVFLPLMPSGVEHLLADLPSNTNLPSVPTFDAFWR